MHLICRHVLGFNFKPLVIFVFLCWSGEPASISHLLLVGKKYQRWIVQESRTSQAASHTRSAHLKAREELILNKQPNLYLNSFILLASTSSSNKNYTVFVTHKMNFLLFAVKLLPELTTVFFRLGRRNQTPQVHSFQSKIPRLPRQTAFFVPLF